jgi:hypothetical protein
MKNLRGVAALLLQALLLRAPPPHATVPTRCTNVNSAPIHPVTLGAALTELNTAQNWSAAAPTTNACQMAF